MTHMAAKSTIAQEVTGPFSSDPKIRNRQYAAAIKRDAERARDARTDDDKRIAAARWRALLKKLRRAGVNLGRAGASAGAGGSHLKNG